MRCAVIRDDVCVGVINWDGVGPSMYELEELRTMDDVSMPATELVGKTVDQLERLTQTKLGAPGVGIPGIEDAKAFEASARALAIEGRTRREQGEEAVRKEDGKSTDNRSDREFAHHEPTATSASSVKDGAASKTKSGHRIIDPEVLNEDRVNPTAEAGVRRPFVGVEGGAQLAGDARLARADATNAVVTRKVEVLHPEPRFEPAPKPSNEAKADHKAK